MFLQELQHFVAAAESLNFSEAARQISMTKSGLGKTIARMEEELGVQLFVRDKQHVVLTPAGQKFLDSANQFLTDCGYINLMSTKYDDIKHEKITIGIPRHYGHYAYFQSNKFINQFFKNRESLNLEVKCMPIINLQQDYLRGNIDFIMGNYSVMRDLPACEYYPYSPRFRQIALSRKHPLASADSLKMSQFKNESFIAIDRNITTYGYDYDLNLCINYGGFFPKIVKEVDDFDILYLLLEHSNMVTITAIPPDLPTLKTIIIEEIGESEPLCSVFVGWRKDNHKSAISLVSDKLTNTAHMQCGTDVSIRRED